MKKFVIYLLSLASVGCVSEIVRKVETVETPPLVLTAADVRFLEQLGRPTALSEDETDRLVGEAARLLDVPRGATRNAPATRTAASIRPLVVADAAGGTTRGGAAGETLLNVVDFEEGRGYCVVAADRRIPQPIICFVGDGSFPAASDTIANPGLRFMLDAMEAYALRSVERHGSWCDSVETSLLARAGTGSIEDVKASMTRVARGEGDEDGKADEDAEYESVEMSVEPQWRLNRHVAPMVPVEWGQQSPFNATVVANTEWSSTPVGCVALAAVGIMAYWGHPVEYHDLGGGSIDWAELTRWSGYRWNRADRYRNWDGPMTSAPDETRKLAADLLWHVADDVDMDFGASVSLAYTRDAAVLLAEHGFSQSEGVSFSEDVVVGSLDAARPLLISGASHKLATATYYANSHAWLVDGYIEQRRYDCFMIDHHFYECEWFRRYLHNNFGWNGLDNGYYACGLFDTNKGPDLPSDLPSATRAEWIGKSYNYQFNITVYPDIHK